MTKKHIAARRSGMTMIELVSALMLFILILGGLTMALNKATTLWSPSHTKQKEQVTADLTLSLIEDDLKQAVTDNVPAINNDESKPTFFVDSEPINNAGDVKIVLQFIRHRSYKSKQKNKEIPALDAIFYTYYDNALFRHAVPLKYANPNQPEHIGEMLQNLTTSIETPALHAQILDYFKNPLGTAPPGNGEFSLLAQNIHQPIIIAGMPTSYVTASTSKLYNPSFTLNNSIQTIPEYIKLAATVLPDYIFVALRIFNDSDWIAYQTLIDSADTATIKRDEPHLGKVTSRRISFWTTRGTRLK